MDICGAANVPSTPGEDGSASEPRDPGTGVTMSLERKGTAMSPIPEGTKSHLSSSTARSAVIRGSDARPPDIILSETAENDVVNNSNAMTSDKVTSTKTTGLQNGIRGTDGPLPDVVLSEMPEIGSMNNSNAKTPYGVASMEKTGLQNALVKTGGLGSTTGAFLDNGSNPTMPSSAPELASTEKSSLMEKSADHATVSAKTEKRKRKSRNVTFCGTTDKEIKEDRSGGTAFNIDDLALPNGFRGLSRRNEP